MRIPPTPFLTIITIILLINLSAPSYSLSFPQSGPESGASISVSPKTLSKSGDTVHIHWSGIDPPSQLDWLGIYSPPDSPHDHFIGYVFLSSDPNYISSGSGSVSLPLPNLRSNYSFRVFRWSESEIDPARVDHDNNPIPGSDHYLAGSEEVGYWRGHGAEQIHLAFTDRVDEMRVVFVAGDGGERYVRYGRREDGGGGRRRREWEGREVTRVERYEREDMCDSPANESVGWRDPGWIHDAVMRGLKKGVRYYYQVGSDSTGWSPTYSFVSRDPDSNETIAFIFGDMGTATPYNTFYRTQDESIATVKWILRDVKALGNKPTFISHIGDISYARGYSWVWDHFFSQIEPIAANVPYHVCIGNHEYDWPLQPWRPEWATNVYKTDGGGECGVPYSLRFKMPGNSSEPTGTRAPATRNLYYSFDVGVVHFVYFSTETDFLPGGRQYDFLKHDLESVDRNKTPFVVVQGHRPMYTSSYAPKDAPVRERMMEHLEPLFVKNKVTLVLWGHVHRYERFCPMKNFTCASSAGEDGGTLPIHAVIGMGGQDWQPIWEPRPDHPKDPIYPQPKWSLYRSGEFGYTRLVATREKLTLSYVGNHDGKVHDMVEIMGSRQTQSSDVDGADRKLQVVESTPSCFMGVMVMIVGAFLGYIVGVISRTKHVAMARHGWIPVKNEEMVATI